MDGKWMWVIIAHLKRSINNQHQGMLLIAQRIISMEGLNSSSSSSDFPAHTYKIQIESRFLARLQLALIKLDPAHQTLTITRPNKTSVHSFSDLEVSRQQIKVKSTGRVYKTSSSRAFQNYYNKVAARKVSIQGNDSQTRSQEMELREYVTTSYLLGQSWIRKGGVLMLKPQYKSQHWSTNIKKLMEDHKFLAKFSAMFLCDSGKPNLLIMMADSLRLADTLFADLDEEDETIKTSRFIEFILLMSMQGVKRGWPKLPLEGECVRAQVGRSQIYLKQTRYLPAVTELEVVAEGRYKLTGSVQLIMQNLGKQIIKGGFYGMFRLLFKDGTQIVANPLKICCNCSIPSISIFGRSIFLSVNRAAVLQACDGKIEGKMVQLTGRQQKRNTQDELMMLIGTSKCIGRIECQGWQIIKSLQRTVLLEDGKLALKEIVFK